MVYLNLDKPYFKSHEKEWNDEAMKEFGSIENGGDSFLITDDTNGVIDEIDADEGTFSVKVEDSKLGYMSFDVVMTPDILADLLEIAIKKLNKAKAVLEGLK